MQWDDVKGPRSFFGKAPVDIYKPIEIGETAKLRSNRHEIKVKIIECQFDVIKGEVIDDSAEIGLVTLVNGDMVEFGSQHIVTLYRN
ncbi:hypothetical protein [Photobacterium piscicola]|uniref:Uncharacterized protein n=1 Tax=Photobacterium piscicola TaxID=1378299 RepID=A0A1T5HWY0_9GAMM|nr:hypothetical protein [Photobacterium piscicola]MEC6824011.1 hypothetical protein [Photobacterium piscicola]MEC6882145.1 hypothetical protein [Photobacterium piscicola]MEC6899529.1 hypothetical protein [Photobacterium piscicola]SKC31275.1 hypothetical protein CZ809_00753 [Photobacterium piscicola]